MKTCTLIILMTVLGLGGCEYRSARGEFERQLNACTEAESKGLLVSAAQGCQAALAIAEEQGYASDLISSVLYRLGRLERQRTRFTQAEALMRRSLEIEEQSGAQGAIASRLVELALSVAGEGRWADGAQLLERALPLVMDLTGKDRIAAANAFRLFGVRLRTQGETVQAERFQAVARELAQT